MNRSIIIWYRHHIFSSIKHLITNPQVSEPIWVPLDIEVNGKKVKSEPLPASTFPLNYPNGQYLLYEARCVRDYLLQGKFRQLAEQLKTSQFKYIYLPYYDHIHVNVIFFNSLLDQSCLNISTYMYSDILILCY